MIPNPQIIQLKTKTVALCPKCNLYIPFRSLRKDKTFSGIEYRNHCKREHNA